MTDQNSFSDRVGLLSNEELVATYQYVSGLFAKYTKDLVKDNRIASDLMDLKHEILKRLEDK